MHPVMYRELHAERHRELEKRVANRRLIEAIPRLERHGRLDHLRVAVGKMLIAAGQRLNPAEQPADATRTVGADDLADAMSLKLAR